MKYFSSDTEFSYSWDKVTSAFWHRYPNPFATHVLSEDTISRRVCELTGRLISKRLISKKGSKVPKWGEPFLPKNRQAYVVEESIVDPKTQTFTTYTRNIGYQRVMLVEEKCVYQPNPTNASHTICKRETFVSSQIYGFRSAIQGLGLDKMKKRAAQSVEGYKYILNTMYSSEKMSDNVGTATIGKSVNEKLKIAGSKAKDIAKTKAAAVMVSS